METFVGKLKALKKCLKVWSWDSFGNIFTEASHAEEEIKAIEDLLDNNPTPMNLEHLREAKVKHSGFLQRVTEYWKQKSDFKWLREGDSNTALFHQSVKIKRAALRIHRIQNAEGHWVDDINEIAKSGG